MNTTDASVLIGPNGKPARSAVSDDCPRCRAGKDKRVASAGFGEPHDVCSKCGFEWEEFTCERQ